ncbi:MAG: cell division ATP-binding protein FtsE [Firmicutes bacterium]|nr:cell division ATP-binding protein FtsE [Bacillota bacterium]MCL5039557.1 cell division ATP-binding protein FtsE [Bacillota bacterium]
MVLMEHVSKVYSNKTVALLNVGLEIKKGEFVFVVGPSGAGKSTFIKLLIREDLPTQGRVVVNGQDLATLRPRQIPLLRRTIGVVFQDFRLLPNKTVYDNVAFAMEVVESPRRDIRKRVPAVLDLVGLRQKARAFPAELSGGEQQRVALARAIVNNPALVIADEPTGNLDHETSMGILNLLLEINRMGTTVIMATHARNLVNAAKKRVIALEKGRLVRDDEEASYEITRTAMTAGGRR